MVAPGPRAWVIGTDIDGDDTLVAGTQALADAILAHPILDGKQVTGNDRLTDRT